MSEISLKNRLYAHVFFKENALDIAVYSLGKVPGFSTKIEDPALREEYSPFAFEAFTKILKNKLSPEQLQQGGIIDYESIKNDLPEIEKLGKEIADNPNLKVVVNLDSNALWFKFYVEEFAPADQQAAENPECNHPEHPEFKKKSCKQAKIDRAIQYKDDLYKTLQAKSKSKESLYKKLYTFISFKYNPDHGPKDYTKTVKQDANATKKSPTPPPTFLVSKGGPGQPGFVFFPGYRGAHYLTQAPDAPMEGKKSPFFTAPGDTKSEDANPAIGQPMKTWYTKLITDVRKYTKNNLPPSLFNRTELVYVTEEVAHSFYKELSSDPNALSWTSFNKATPKAKETGIELIKELEPTSNKLASGETGTWIDLQTGRIFDSEESLISSMKDEEESYSEGFAIAAKSKFRISKIASSLLLRGNRKLFKKLIKIIR